MKRLTQIQILVYLIVLPNICLAQLSPMRSVVVDFPNPPILNVTTTEDGHDTNPGDGRCHIGTRLFRGNCSLRAAIEEANHRVGAQTIIIPPGTYGLTLGQLLITQSVTLHGSDKWTTVIDGNRQSRVLVISSLSPIMTAEPAVTVHISGVTIQNGYESFYATGGAFVDKGTSLTLNNSIVTKNYANQFGGGMGNSGYLKLIDSMVTENSVPEGEGGGVTASGGGIFNNGSAITEIWSSTISGNKGTRGAGIYNLGELHLKNSTVSGNSAQTQGGGILNYGYLATSFVTITDNTASLARGVASERTGGGGLYNAAMPPHSVHLSSTILAGNVDYQGSPSLPDFSPDCFSTGPIITEGTNLFGMTGGPPCLMQGSRPGDPLDVYRPDPLLEPLSGTGGPTWTHRLKSDSPAVDKAKRPVGLHFYDCPANDQMGNIRPIDGDNDGTMQCDIGAVER